MTRREEIQRVFATNFPYTYRGFSVHFSEPDENDHGVRHPERICSGEVSPLVFFHTFNSKEKEEQTMARIANKKTGKLTKQYRDPCVFHASSRRRSYRRKGTSTRRKRASYVSYTTVNDPVANAIATIIVGGGFLALLMWLLPIFVPIFVGFILLWGVDKICKAKWNLPSGKWSMPASWGWTILTGVEMIVSFVIVLLIVIEEATMTALIVNLVIYIGLSAWILISKHNKIKKASVT